MTAFDRFDPFERRITDAIDEIAAPRLPDYLDDILRQTARTSQRPRWTFPERWFNVDTAISRPSPFGRLPLRQLVVLALLAALAAAALAFYIGSQRKLPPPIGPARNGQIVYGIGGDLYVRDSMAATPRLLIGGPSEQGGVVVSPDGQLIAYDSVVKGVDNPWVANIDGSNPRKVLDQPFTGMTFQWSYDSRSAVVVTDSAGHLQLWNAPADGSGAIEIKLDGLWPLEATWDPTRAGVLLVRGEDRATSDVDLYYVNVTTTPATIVSKIDMPDGTIEFGTSWHYVAIAFSPDGSLIAYADPESESSSRIVFRTHLMSRDGTGNRTIAGPDILGYNQSWPVFSPDGRTIALESWVPATVGDMNTLAIAPTDLSSPASRVGPTLAHSLLKSWSPDGTRLLLAPTDTMDAYSIDPVSGAYEKLPFQLDYVPGWQRLAP